MKQNELFNKCCDNCDPNTREEVWKQMDKELGRTELEQAAEDYAQSLSKGAMTGKEYCKQDFKAGAEWQKEQYKELIRYCQGILIHWGEEQGTPLEGLVKILQKLEEL